MKFCRTWVTVLPAAVEPCSSWSLSSDCQPPGTSVLPPASAAWCPLTRRSGRGRATEPGPWATRRSFLGCRSSVLPIHESPSRTAWWTAIHASSESGRCGPPATWGCRRPTLGSRRPCLERRPCLDDWGGLRIEDRDARVSILSHCEVHRLPVLRHLLLRLLQRVFLEATWYPFRNLN